jgi:hypothetical protein
MGEAMIVLPVHERQAEEIKRLRHALHSLRNLVKEGDAPRYFVTPGAALNSVIEEVVDPALRRTPRYGKPQP